MAAALLGVVSVGWTDMVVEVTGSRVNLRAIADENAEVVGQAKFGERLLARSVSDQWVGIRAPEYVTAWISAEFVTNQTVIATELNVRGGPNINYRPLGRLTRGTKVKVLETFGDWLKIAPTDELTVWIYSDFLRKVPPPDPPPEVSPPPPVRPDPPPVVDAPDPPLVVTPVDPGLTEEAKAPPPPPELKLIPLDGQGKQTVLEGMLSRKNLLLGGPSDYRLVTLGGGFRRTVCYLHGNRPQLESLRGAHAKIQGREYWVQGENVPVLVIDKIIIVEMPPPRSSSER